MNISSWASSMEFELVLFAKVATMIVIHGAVLYFVFRQLDKIFGAKR